MQRGDQPAAEGRSLMTEPTLASFFSYRGKRDFPSKSTVNHAYSGGEGERTW
jgi:hypothetical protein